MKDELEKYFPSQVWVLWDERLTSKQAQGLQSGKIDKQKIHSVAAALILEAYLMHVQYKKMVEEQNT